MSQTYAHALNLLQRSTVTKTGKQKHWSVEPGKPLRFPSLIGLIVHETALRHVTGERLEAKKVDYQKTVLLNPLNNGANRTRTKKVATSVDWPKASIFYFGFCVLGVC